MLLLDETTRRWKTCKEYALQRSPLIRQQSSISKLAHEAAEYMGAIRWIQAITETQSGNAALADPVVNHGNIPWDRWSSCRRTDLGIGSHRSNAAISQQLSHRAKSQRMCIDCWSDQTNDVVMMKQGGHDNSQAAIPPGFSASPFQETRYHQPRDVIQVKSMSYLRSAAAELIFDRLHVLRATYPAAPMRANLLIMCSEHVYRYTSSRSPASKPWPLPHAHQ